MSAAFEAGVTGQGELARRPIQFCFWKFIGLRERLAEDGSVGHFCIRYHHLVGLDVSDAEHRTGRRPLLI